MRKAIIIGIIIAVAIVIGVSSLSVFNNNTSVENSGIGNKTMTNSTKHYTVNLEEKVGVKTPP